MQPISGQIRLNSEPGNTQADLDLQAPSVSELDNAVVAIRGDVTLGGARLAADALSARILSAYRASGPEALSELRGAFALVIWLPSNDRVLIAIDRMGVERLAWGSKDNKLAVGTSAEDVARRLHGTPEVDSQAIFDFMLGHMVPAPATVFRGVQKLQAGIAIEFTGGEAKETRYWRPDFSRPARDDTDALRDSVVPTLSRAIELTQPDEKTGSFLSGGLDSSTVTGLLAQVSEPSANAFSVGFGVAEFDEMEFADAASEYFGCRHFKYEVTADDIVEAIPLIARTYDEPFGNSSAVPTYFCARLAKSNGVDHLLAGDGGDELFGGNERYVRHRIFEMYSKIPAIVRTALLEPAAMRIDPETSPLPFRKFSSYVRQAKIPLPERFESWNLIYREGPERVFSQAFLELVDPNGPLERMLEAWNSCPSNDLLDRMLWYDWKFTLADNDLRKVSTMCELAGVKVSYPMLEEDFVDMSIRVPSNKKIAGHELRKFFRNSVHDFLPRKVIEKDKHGFGLPFGQWLKTHKPLQDIVYGSLESLKNRNIFDPDFLDRVAAEHRDGHASYYGYAIWDLTMLEQWFQYHVTPQPA